MGKIETTIQNSIIRFLNSRRIWNLRYQTATNRFGVPDILACYKGVMLGIEVKTDEGRSTKLQELTMRSINKCGGKGFIARSVKDVESVLEEIDGLHS